MKIDKSKLIPAVEKFNSTYGCQFDIEKYEDALEETINDKTPERIDKVYKDMFAEIYKQSIQSASEGKIERQTGFKMLKDFEDNVVFPLIYQRMRLGYNTVARKFGGVSMNKRQEFINEIESQMPVIEIEEEPKQLDLSVLTPAIDKFNAEYGCRFDLKKYTNALEKYSKDTTPERINNVYKEIFTDLHKQALKGVSSEKINRFSAGDMLFDFEMDIIQPLLKMREDAGIKDIAESNGGMSIDERRDLTQNLDAELAKIKINRPAKPYNINDFQEAVNKFNETYGCQFDIKKYADALKKFANDETPERINQAYKDMFADAYKQTLKGVLNGTAKLESSAGMLNDFQFNIIAPLLIASGYDDFAQPFGGMSELEQFQLMNKCIEEVPSNLINQTLEQYETGKITLKDMLNFATEIFEDPNSIADETKRKFTACIMALEKSYHKRENQDSSIAKQELEHINIFEHNFVLYYGETQYRNYRMKTSQLFDSINDVKREIGQVLIKYHHSEPQWENISSKNHKNRKNAEVLSTPTENIMERYTEGRYPLREMRRFAKMVSENPTLANEEDRTRFVACISAIERIHSTRTSGWMIRNARRYYSEYRDARDMKAAFIKAFGEKQYEISKACADTGCSENDYMDLKNAFVDANESFDDDFEDELEENLENDVEIAKERISFSLEEIDGPINNIVSEPIEQKAPPAKNEPNIKI